MKGTEPCRTCGGSLKNSRSILYCEQCMANDIGERMSGIDPASREYRDLDKLRKEALKRVPRR